MYDNNGMPPHGGMPPTGGLPQKAEMWLMANAKFFKPEYMSYIQSQLELLPEAKLVSLHAIDFKDPTTLLLISIFLGEFGVDRFMLKEVGLGIVKLCTLGGCGVWWFIDLFLIQGKTRDHNLRLFQQMISM